MKEFKRKDFYITLGAMGTVLYSYEVEHFEKKIGDISQVEHLYQTFLKASSVSDEECELHLKNLDKEETVVIVSVLFEVIYGGRGKGGLDEWDFPLRMGYEIFEAKETLTKLQKRAQHVHLNR